VGTRSPVPRLLEWSTHHWAGRGDDPLTVMTLSLMAREKSITLPM